MSERISVTPSLRHFYMALYQIVYIKLGVLPNKLFYAGEGIRTPEGLRTQDFSNPSVFNFLSPAPLANSGTPAYYLFY